MLQPCDVSDFFLPANGTLLNDLSQLSAEEIHKYIAPHQGSH